MHKGQLGTVQVFTMSGTSQMSTAFGGQTRCIRIATEGQPGYFLIGTAPTAAATSNIIGASSIDYITVMPGQKIAVLQAGTAGNISITEMQ